MLESKTNDSRSIAAEKSHPETELNSVSQIISFLHRDDTSLSGRVGLKRCFDVRGTEEADLLSGGIDCSPGSLLLLLSVCNCIHYYQLEYRSVVACLQHPRLGWSA
jgi:hypothetical protein